ncbi:MAG: DUF86 domain-containing protein [Alicyclobacillus sp.]|nr:DUF86 domain-containing protein [Alicyclobacillus sp.]
MVEQRLRLLGERAQWLESLVDNDGWEQDVVQLWAAERALHVALECMTDAANAVIDALVMRDPGGYADIIRVLAEEGVVSWSWFDQFEPVLHFRERLVRGYADLQPADVVRAVRQSASLLNVYADSLRQYLGRDGMV